MIVKQFTLNQLNVGIGNEIVPSVYTGLIGGLPLTDANLSAVRKNAGGTASTLNHMLAKALYNMLINKDMRIDVAKNSVSGFLDIRLKLNSSVSFASTDDYNGQSYIALYGTAMQIQSFMVPTAQTLVAFVLANKHKFPGVAEEFEQMVQANHNNPGSFLECLCRTADAIYYYMEDILGSGNKTGLYGIGVDPMKFEFQTKDSADPKFLIQNSFSDLSALSQYMTTDFTATVANYTSGSAASFVGPLYNKMLRYINTAKHVLISGPTATGKTMCVEEACANAGAPLIIMKGAEHLEDIDMLGGFAPGDDGLRMVYGPLTRALKQGREQYNLQLQENTLAATEGRDPNKIPPAVLFIDEINRLQARFLNIMITAMNITKATGEYTVEIPCNGEEVTCPEGFFMVVGARNLGQLHLNTNDMDMALDRRFYAKLNVNYISRQMEETLLSNKFPALDSDVVSVLCKVAYDTRFQIAQSYIKAPIDTDTLQKWAEEILSLSSALDMVTLNTVIEAAEDIVYGVCLERGEYCDYDTNGITILTDNIKEAWKDLSKTSKRK